MSPATVAILVALHSLSKVFAKRAMLRGAGARPGCAAARRKALTCHEVIGVPLGKLLMTAANTSGFMAA